MGFFSDIFGGEEMTPVPPAPDFAPLIGSMNQQAQYANALSQQQFDFFKQIYTDQKGDIDASAAKFRQMQDQFGAAADEDLQRYRTQFRPAEDRYISEVQRRSSPEFRAQERARAQASQAQAAEAAITRTQQQLASYGVNPSALRNQGVMAALESQKGAAMAAAGSESDRAVDAQSMALNRDVVNMGGEVRNRAAGSAGVASALGTGAANLQNSFTSTTAGTTGTGAQWGGLANNALTGAGNLMNAQYKNQMAQFEAQEGQAKEEDGLGGAIGTLGGALIGGYFGGPMGASVGGKVGGSLFSEEGGEIPEDPHMVPMEASPSGGEETDDVSARLSPGEFVFPKYAVQYFGTKYLQGLISKAQEASGMEQEPARPEMRSAIQRPPTYVSPSNGQTRSALPRMA